MLVTADKVAALVRKSRDLRYNTLFYILNINKLS